MSIIKVVIAISILVLLFAVAYALTNLHIAGPPALTSLRRLAATYLQYSYNPMHAFLTAYAPESLGAILWDYRGLDTLFETMVLFAAIIAAIALYRELVEHGRVGKFIESRAGLSVVIRAVSKVVLWLTLLISVIFALTGHLTPGGGFVGGASFSVIPILIILVFYPKLIEELGISRKRALAIRSIALLTILAIVLVPLAFGGYIFQNQIKPSTRFSYPSTFPGGVPLGGIVFFLNVVEMIAVSTAFALSFIILGYLTLTELKGESR